MERIIVLIGLMGLLISPVLALDSQTINPCGGDNELIIDCLDDQELFFIGLIPRVEIGTIPFSIGVLLAVLLVAITPKKKEVEEENE